MACGTALMMSSDSELTKGINMMPMTSPAVITAVPPDIHPTVSLPKTDTRNGPTVSKANSPYTIVGIPASTSSKGLAIDLTFGVAYSDR